MTTSTSPVRITSREGLAVAGVWYAATSPLAPMTKHLLPPGRPRSFGAGGAVRALCGEQRREWWPADQFAIPDAFDECAHCVALAKGLRA